MGSMMMKVRVGNKSEQRRVKVTGDERDILGTIVSDRNKEIKTKWSVTIGP